MLHVYSQGAFVAMIEKQSKLADYATPETPWLLLHNTGRIDRFTTQGEARDEARKAWPRVTFSRT